MEPYNFFNQNTQLLEIIERERWRWEVIYDDGRGIKQFDDKTMTFHQLSEIDMSRLKTFKMVCDNKPMITIAARPGREIHHSYDNYIFNQGTPEEKKIKVYCFGYTENGQKITFFITPDDQVIIADELDMSVS